MSTQHNDPPHPSTRRARCPLAPLPGLLDDDSPGPPQTLYSCAVIIPLFPPIDLTHLSLVLDQLTLTDVDELIIAIPSEAADALHRKLEVDRWSHIRVVEVSTGSTAQPSRAQLCNEGARAAKSDLLWFHEHHIVLPFKAILARARRCDADLIKPFSHYFRLNREATRAYLSWGSLNDPIFRHGAIMGETPGKASLIVQREPFIASRGFNELFRGLADEGFEFVRRFRRWFRTYEVFKDFTGIQLNTHFDPEAQRARVHNKTLRTQLYIDMDRDLEEYTANSIESCFGDDPETREELVAARDREVAVAPFRFSPPPIFRAPLPGSIWGLTTFFNPYSFRSKSRNYKLFREGIAAQGLPLLTVELSFHDGEFELDESDADHLIQLRARDILWHKERLLNIGLSRLPPDCDKVVWLDCDVLFKRPDWVSRTAELLERYVIVQPFSFSVRLEEGETTIDSLDHLPLGSGEHEVLHSMAYGVAAKGIGVLPHYLKHGHSGYAWAGRRTVLKKHGFYDANILGNADLNMAHAMFDPTKIKLDRFSDPAAEHLMRWARAFHGDVRSSVGYVDATVHHLWHGAKKNRFYDDRLLKLKACNYDPATDLAVDENGVYYWATDKPELREWCINYFSNRNEDG